MVANKLLIGVGGTFAAAVLTIGVVSASGGGPIAFDGGDAPVQEGDDPEASPSATPLDDEDDEQDDENEVEDEDDLEEAAGEVEGDEDGEASPGNEKIAEAIAEEFETTPEEVLALHDEGIGFGAIFKLYLIASAKGITVDELLAEIEEDGGGFAFGKLKKSLSEEEMTIFEDGPKNLGELVSAANHDDDDSDDADTEDGGGEGETSRTGQPDHAKAKGHGKKG